MERCGLDLRGEQRWQHVDDLAHEEGTTSCGRGEENEVQLANSPRMYGKATLSLSGNLLCFCSGEAVQGSVPACISKDFQIRCTVHARDLACVYIYILCILGADAVYTGGRSVVRKE